ncbi:MAG: class I SAM-dependent methyltransferase [Dehalococcoidales bacterium]|nr:class I SAM-dependent methyltransferase [Dehalococcoidales bacterium]
MSANLRDVFNRIAPGWYNYRHWTIFRRELEALAKDWGRGKLLNLGCGHGADFLPFARSFELYGVDFSGEMLKLARKYAEKFGFDVDLALADVCRLPYGDSTFDFVISIATYHHLERQNHLTALSELKRVLKPGGSAFVTVWNRWQPRFWFRGKSVMVPWRAKDEILYRYYYLFSCKEMVQLTQKAGLKVVKVSRESSYRFPFGIFSQNICLLVKRDDAK